MGMYTVSGSKVFIGDALSMGGEVLTPASFSAIAWVQISHVEAIGTVGDKIAVESTAQIDLDEPAGPARLRKFKSEIDPDAMQIVAALDASDAGQIAAVAAKASPSSYAFKIHLGDAAGGAAPSKRMFTALVVEASDILDAANNVMKFGLSLALDSNIVRIDAAG